jgi:hypothetical protein
LRLSGRVCHGNSCGKRDETFHFLLLLKSNIRFFQE